VAARQQRPLPLILARELASQLATATFIADAEGQLVFYNEPAEEILGRSFAEAGSMSASEWGALFNLETLDGDPLAPEQMPAAIALMQQRPAHGRLRMTGLDGVKRTLSVTGIPLFSSRVDCVGMLALFWQEAEGEDG
jgi:PAS domain-containing protein